MADNERLPLNFAAKISMHLNLMCTFTQQMMGKICDNEMQVHVGGMDPNKPEEVIPNQKISHGQRQKIPTKKFVFCPTPNSHIFLDLFDLS
jgi:hypothetical protein